LRIDDFARFVDERNLRRAVVETKKAVKLWAQRRNRKNDRLNSSHWMGGSSLTGAASLSIER
jgi:hypothetical protein